MTKIRLNDRDSRYIFSTKEREIVMSKTCKIVVVGSFITDITGFAPRFPGDGETVLGSAVKFGPGGKGSNQATAASRSGGEVVMVTKIGTDMLSDIARKHYTAEGMTQKYVTVTDKADTGSAFIEVSETTGENRIIVVKGANAYITKEDVYAAEQDIAESNAVLTQLESSLDSVIALKELAEKYGKPFVLNPAPMQEVPEGLFKGIDFFTPNETEAEFFSGVKVTSPETAEEAADRLLALGVKNVIITLGKKGGFWTNGTEKALVPTTDLKPVDTTGAGDAFNGGFTVAISEGRDVIDAMKFGNSVASISVTRKGSSPSMPTREETDALYNRFYLGK